MAPKSLAPHRQQETKGPMEAPISTSALSGLASHSSSLQGLFLLRYLNGSFSGVQTTAEPSPEALGSTLRTDPCSQNKIKFLGAM